MREARHAQGYSRDVTEQQRARTHAKRVAVLHDSVSWGFYLAGALHFIAAARHQFHRGGLLQAAKRVRVQPTPMNSPAATTTIVQRFAPFSWWADTNTLSSRGRPRRDGRAAHVGESDRVGPNTPSHG